VYVPVAVSVKFAAGMEASVPIRPLPLNVDIAIRKSHSKMQ
jgi:hypothetical protein